MADQFDPAPHDKYAADPRQALNADREAHRQLEKGLMDSFPASDPPSATQPARSTADSERPNKTLWQRLKALFN